jgi:hypothetical protein
MLHLARAIFEVLSDLVKLAVLFLRTASAIRAQNLALRRQCKLLRRTGMAARSAVVYPALRVAMPIPAAHLKRWASQAVSPMAGP